MKQSDYVAKGINTSCTMINDSAYIYREDTKEILKLNEAGSFLWSLITGSVTVEEIINKCLLHYDGDKKEIISSFEDFLLSLYEEKIIEFSEDKFEGVIAYERRP